MFINPLSKNSVAKNKVFNIPPRLWQRMTYPRATRSSLLELSGIGEAAKTTSTVAYRNHCAARIHNRCRREGDLGCNGRFSECSVVVRLKFQRNIIVRIRSGAAAHREGANPELICISRKIVQIVNKSILVSLNAGGAEHRARGGPLGAVADGLHPHQGRVDSAGKRRLHRLRRPGGPHRARGLDVSQADAEEPRDEHAALRPLQLPAHGHQARADPPGHQGDHHRRRLPVLPALQPGAGLQGDLQDEGPVRHGDDQHRREHPGVRLPHQADRRRGEASRLQQAGRLHHRRVRRAPVGQAEEALDPLQRNRRPGPPAASASAASRASSTRKACR